MTTTPPKAKPPKPSRHRRFLILVPVLLLAAAAGTFIAVQDLRRYAETPVRLPGSGEKLLTIAPGESFRSVTRSLLALGLIRSPLRFRIYARTTGLDRSLKAGEYDFHEPASPKAILERLVEGRIKLYRITVPEGLTMAQVADLVGDSGLVSREDFLAAAAGAEAPGRFGIEARTLEGYLFPDTYSFPRGATAEAIVDAMVRRFQAVMTDERLALASAIGMTTHEVVTLASIIEKETGAPSERPLISSVFHNRLRRGMRLETDPTVIYGIEDFDGNLTRKHLKTPTPYNTYLIEGLPPGPIANPGEAAIDAALHPAETDYLFFVSRQDGTHQFSKNLKDHQSAVRKYQLGGRSNGRSKAAPAEGTEKR
jgi:UPF0755 protein